MALDDIKLLQKQIRELQESILDIAAALLKSVEVNKRGSQMLYKLTEQVAVLTRLRLVK